MTHPKDSSTQQPQTQPQLQPGSKPPQIFDPTIALNLTSITKTFGQVRALDAAELLVRTNTIHALLGENGAGKTTLMRIAFGMTAPTAGSIIVNGEARSFRSSADAIAAGIGMVHQHFTLVPAMTVAENIALGGHGRLHIAKARDTVRAVGQETGLAVDPNAIVSSLSIGAQQRVEILKAFVKEAKILILDEPTAVLAPQEAHELLTQLRHFARTKGTVILITHKLRDAIEFADDVTVLRRGKTVLAAKTESVTEHVLASAMIGVDPNGSIDINKAHNNTLVYRPAQHAVFNLDNVSASNERGVRTLTAASLQVHANEVVGIAAVEGNGQYELLRILAGRLQSTSGTTQIPPTVGFIPEDRHRDAIILDFPLYENVALQTTQKSRGLITWDTLKQRTNAMMAAYDVRAPQASTIIRTLSGGNQQRLVVGREFDAKPSGIVLENPTRGLDVQASNAVHRHIAEARDRGAAVVVYSTDLDELLALSDRIVVLHGGTLTAVPKDRNIIGQTMLGLDVTGLKTEAEATTSLTPQPPYRTQEPPVA